MLHASHVISQALTFTHWIYLVFQIKATMSHSLSLSLSLYLALRNLRKGIICYLGNAPSKWVIFKYKNSYRCYKVNFHIEFISKSTFLLSYYCFISYLRGTHHTSTQCTYVTFTVYKHKVSQQTTFYRKGANIFYGISLSPISNLKPKKFFALQGSCYFTFYKKIYVQALHFAKVY
jgi:hypothetical protein